LSDTCQSDLKSSDQGHSRSTFGVRSAVARCCMSKLMDQLNYQLLDLKQFLDQGHAYSALPAPTAHRDLFKDSTYKKRKVLAANKMFSFPYKAQQFCTIHTKYTPHNTSFCYASLILQCARGADLASCCMRRFVKNSSHTLLTSHSSGVNNRLGFPCVVSIRQWRSGSSTSHKPKLSQLSAHNTLLTRHRCSRIQA
jgi:hypothetical protein